jgi:hypothetical protein
VSAFLVSGLARGCNIVCLGVCGATVGAVVALDVGLIGVLIKFTQPATITTQIMPIIRAVM